MNEEKTIVISEQLFLEMALKAVQRDAMLHYAETQKFYVDKEILLTLCGKQVRANTAMEDEVTKVAAKEVTA